MAYHSGRHFLQIPGPTNVPDRVLRAIEGPTIDHRGPLFSRLALDVLEGLKTIFQTSQPVIIYPSSGTGAWEAALVNTLSPGDRVLMFETGHFGTLWRNMAQKLGLDVQFVAGDWRHGVKPATVEELLIEDRTHASGVDITTPGRRRNSAAVTVPQSIMINLTRSDLQGLDRIAAQRIPLPLLCITILMDSLTAPSPFYLVQHIIVPIPMLIPGRDM